MRVFAKFSVFNNLGLFQQFSLMTPLSVRSWKSSIQTQNKIIIEKGRKNSVLTALELGDTVKPLLFQQLNAQQIQPTSGNPVVNFNFVKIFAVKAGKQGFILEIQQKPSRKVSPASRE